MPDEKLVRRRRLRIGEHHMYVSGPRGRKLGLLCFAHGDAARRDGKLGTSSWSWIDRDRSQSGRYVNGATPSAAAASFNRRSRLASGTPSWIASAR